MIRAGKIPRAVTGRRGGEFEPDEGGRTMSKSTPHSGREHNPSGGQVVPFSHEDFGTLRWTVEDGVSKCMLADAARMLEYSSAQAAQRHLRDSQFNYASRVVASELGQQGGRAPILITESGLWRLIMRSSMPRAEAVQEWVEDVVLPSIRKTGSYGAVLAAPELSRRELAMMVIAEADRADREMRARIDAEEDSEIAIAVARELLPSAEAWEELADADGDYSVRAAAQMLARAGIKTGQNRLFATMVDLGWLDMRKQPYQTQVDNGRLCRKASYWTDPETGETHQRDTVRVTPKGLEALLAKMK